MRPTNGTLDASRGATSGPVVLMSVLRSNASWVVGGAISGVIWRLLMFVPPVALGRAIDEGVIDENTGAGLLWIGVAALAGVLVTVMSMARHWFAAAGYFIAHDSLRRRLLAFVQRVDLDWHAARSRGEVLSGINADTRVVVSIVDEIPSFAGSVVSLVLTAAALSFVSRELALIAAATIPAAFLVVLISGRRISSGTEEMQHHTAEMTGTLEETLAGIVVVKSLGAEEARMEVLRRDSDAVRETSAKLERTQAALSELAAILPGMAIAAGLWVGGRQVAAGDLSVGALAAFLAWMLLYGDLITTIADRVATLLRTLAAARRVDTVLAQPVRQWGDRDVPGEAPALRVRGLSVGRGRRLLLDNISFDVAHGDRVALTGATGSGKSTLLATLPGLVAPDSGSVEIDGTPIEAFRIESLRRAVVLVPEDAFIFEDSVRQNLTLGESGYSDHDLWRALELACVGELVRGLEGQLDAQLGHTGREVSGGETQRLCLARALLRHPPILLLDQSLSAVDEETEAAILQRLDDWPGTVIFTSNRPLLLGFARRRLHLVDGRLVGEAPTPSLPAAYVPFARADGAHGLRYSYTDDDVPARLHQALSSGTDVDGVLRQAWPLLRPFARTMVVAALLSLAATGVTLLGPQVIRRVVDEGLLQAEGDTLALLALTYAAIGVTAATLRYAFTAISARAGETALHAIRVRTWDSLHLQPLGFFEAVQTGELLSRATDDVQQLAYFVRHSLERVVTLIAMLVLGFAFMLATSWILTLVGLGILALNVIGLAVYARLSPAYYAAWDQAEAEAVGSLNQAIAGVTVTQAMGRPQYTTDRAAAAGERYVRTSRSMVAFENFSFFPVELTGAITAAVVVGAGILLINWGFASVGDVVAMAIYVQMMLEPLNILTEIVGSAQKSRVALARLLSIQSLPPESDDETVEAIPWRGALDLNAVSFAYQPRRPVLADVTFSVSPGRQAALVGPTGTGKSTLAKLIAGLERPQAGRITIGGVSIHRSSLENRRRAVAYIPQDGHLFSGTIADNLRLARASADDADLLQAVESAGIQRLIARLPDGLRSPVGRRGALLSAGERQLIGLARLALRDPAVIILDESTSRMDDITETDFEKSLRRLGAGRCMIVIAHRPSTIAMADEVLELRDGSVYPLHLSSN